MKDKLFSTEGPVFEILDQIGRLIVLSVLWLLCSLPLITLGCSTAALFAGVQDSVVRGIGSTLKTFFRCFRRSLKTGLAVQLAWFAAAAVFAVLLSLGRAAMALAAGCLIMLGLAGVWIGPVLAKTDADFRTVCICCAGFAVRFPGRSALLLIGTAVLILLQLQVFPMALLLLTPGAYVRGLVLLTEPVLRNRFPDQEC